MRQSLKALAAVTITLVVSAPGVAPAAGEVVLNPFGNWKVSVLTEPSGTTPGTARATIVTANGVVTGKGETAYFGLRVMGGEDVQMTGFRLVGGDAGACIVSDFAGTNTDGWQGGAVFGAGADPIGSANSHMRMIGGFLHADCGNLQIDLTYHARPFATFYAAFYGLAPAPWHRNYDEAPWNVVPTGGDDSTRQWWNLWGTFDTLGYSAACTSVSGTGAATCG